MPLGVELGLGTGHIVLDGDPALPPPKVHSPQYSAHICCGQMAGWIKMPLGREIGRSPSDIVLDGDPAPPPPKGTEPQFSSHVYCGQTARWIKMALGTQVGLGSAQRRSVRWGTSSPSVKGARPQFSVHVYSDQTARWMKMPLGTEGDLSPGRIMLDGDPAPTCERGTAAHGRSSQLLLSSLGLQTVAETLC